MKFKALFAGSFVALAALSFSPMVQAQDLLEGVEAAQRGDFATAMREWKPLAEQGNLRAQYNLGLMYHTGRGVPQDYGAAVEWYRKSAAQGADRAQYNLGTMYHNGQGVPQDYGAAVKWYRRAAEQGYAAAQSNLGTMYTNGLGVPQDYVRAHMWENLAGAQGDKIAAKNREKIAKKITPAQIAEAQKLARDCLARKYKDCD